MNRSGFLERMISGPDIKIAIDDPHLASLRVSTGWVCEIIEVPDVPSVVQAMCAWLIKKGEEA